MLDSLEAANTHASRALDHLKNLALQVDLTMADRKNAENIFDGHDEDFIKTQIEEFLMYAQLLMETNPEMQSIMLSILAKLSVIESHNLGLECFTMLREQLRSGS